MKKTGEIVSVTALREGRVESEGGTIDTTGGNMPRILRGKYTAFSDDGKGLFVFEPDTEIVYHHSRRQSRALDTSNEGLLYTMEVLRPGQFFTGRIRGQKRYLEVLLRILESGRGIRLGKSKSAQYGKCVLETRGEILPDTNTMCVQKGEEIFLALETDSTFVKDGEGKNACRTNRYEDVRCLLSRCLLSEETGLKGAYIKQFHTFSDPNRDPRERVITIAYYALVKMQEVRGGDDAARAEWFALDEVPSLAFDHDLILRLALKELRKQIHFEPVGFELLPEKFTIKELQLLYEAILDVKFDRRNFYNKMKHLEILTQLDETAHNSPRKEAFLFKFNPKKYDELKQKGFRLEF